MPQFSVQVIAKINVSRQIVVEATDEIDARDKALQQVREAPRATFTVPGERQYHDVLLDTAELEDWDTDDLLELDD